MSLVIAFNKHFDEFINDILDVFPDNVDIVTAKNLLSTIKKSNPKMLLKIWLTYVVVPYKEQIEKGDINFFLKKDYTADVEQANNSDKIMESIDRLRKPVQEMSKENQSKSMKYIQNLSKIALMCNS